MRGIPAFADEQWVGDRWYPARPEIAAWAAEFLALQNGLVLPEPVTEINYLKFHFFLLVQGQIRNTETKEYNEMKSKIPKGRKF